MRTINERKSIKTKFKNYYRFSLPETKDYLQDEDLDEEEMTGLLDKVSFSDFYREFYDFLPYVETFETNEPGDLYENTEEFDLYLHFAGILFRVVFLAKPRLNRMFISKKDVWCYQVEGRYPESVVKGIMMELCYTKMIEYVPKKS